MKLYNEDDLLKVQTRKQIIDGIRSSGNQARKAEARRRHELMKDKTVKYVIKKLEEENLKPATVQLMKNRASNISIMKKVINKLAKAYQYGVRRDAGSDIVNSQVDLLSTLLDFNNRMKKSDRFLRAMKNALLWFMPEFVGMGVDFNEKWIVKALVMGPWEYDAVENAKDVDCPVAIVLSDYNPGYATPTPTDGRGAGVSGKGSTALQGSTADDNKQYIFWSNRYHFTCDKTGAIIGAASPPDLMNPIGEIPGIPMAVGRDDCFWADGGEDLPDGSILVNTMVTDMNAILYMQGWGQMVITGEKGSVPKQMETGPHHAMVLTHDSKKNQKPATVTVVNSNPPVDAWMRAVEQYVALLLSTNNLSPRVMAAKMDAVSFPSGIAMLIESADSTEDVTESQGEFARVERKAWKKYALWHNLYHDRKALDDEFQAVGRLPDPAALNVNPVYNKAAEVVSESEKLDNMKKKKDLAIVRQVELIMQDNPGMTEKEAEKKLLQIKEEQVAAAELEARKLADGGEDNQQEQE